MPHLTYLLLLLALQLQPAQSSTPKPIRIALGAPVVPLSGPWKFRTGDDPRWSDPNFDDSSWEAVDLTPTEGSHDADVGLSGYVPGWTTKGHADYSGFAWYRLRVSIDTPRGDKLALAGPPDVDDAYQLFVDGQLLGGAGDFSRATPVVLSVQPRKFPLSNASAASGTNSRDVVMPSASGWLPIRSKEIPMEVEFTSRRCSVPAARSTLAIKYSGSKLSAAT